MTKWLWRFHRARQRAFLQLDHARSKHRLRTWRKGDTARVNTPLYLRDNIRVSLLAKAYAKFAAEIAAGTGRGKLNPSGYVETQGAFAERFAAAMRPRLGLACGVDLATQTDFSEPMMRVNIDSAAHYVGEWDESAAPGTRRRRNIGRT